MFGVVLGGVDYDFVDCVVGFELGESGGCFGEGVCVIDYGYYMIVGDEF